MRTAPWLQLHSRLKVNCGSNRVFSLSRLCLQKQPIEQCKKNARAGGTLWLLLKLQLRFHVHHIHADATGQSKSWPNLTIG